jgi:Bacterial extracellular solute-binding protein
MAQFEKAGVEYPRTWADLLQHGRVLEKQGNPVGIAISHCGDAMTTYWSIAWCHGAKVVDVDGETPAIVSDKTAQAIEYYEELYRDAMDPEVLSWDDASNNRGMKEKMRIADDIDMVAKAVNGMPTERAMEWGQDQVALALKGQLKASG